MGRCAFNFHLRSWRKAIAVQCAFVMCTFVWFASASAANSAIEQHIEHIQNGLIPPVLVADESIETSKLTDRMAALHVQGVSIAVIHDEKIEWARGFGVSKVGGPQVTPSTLFQAASISKPLTALAVLRLVQAGKLNLDTDVNEYLKVWKVPANAFTDQKKVTLRELLTHTAGMTVHGFPGYATDAKLPTVVQILDGVSPANTPAIRVDTQPGTIWRYSGGGYVIVQQLLEDVTGEPFYKLMQDSVLAPIGMKESTYEQPLPEARIAQAAVPYRSNGEAVKGGPHIYPERAPAGLWTTPSDLARYAIEVQRSLKGDSKRVLSAAMTREMLTPGIGQQGLGPQIGGTAPHFYFAHTGANEGYQCGLIAYENGDGAVVMTNSDNGGQLAIEITRTIAHEYGWPDFQPKVRHIAKIDPKRFDVLAGSYQLAPNFIIAFTRNGDRFISQATGQGQIEIFPESERDYFAKIVDAAVTFEIDDQGRASQLVFHQNGRDMTAKRVDEETEKRIADTLAVVNKRIQDQKAAPGSEAALRRLISELAAGTPDYDRMSPALAQFIRQQLPQLQAQITQLGAVSSVTFKGVGPAGGDIYRVACEHRTAEWRILLGRDGRIEGAVFPTSD